MIGVFQPWHLIVVLVIVVMVFGPGKLPELGRALGDGLRELKRSSGDGAINPASLAFAAAAGAACISCNTTLPTAARYCGLCGAAQAVTRAA
jgi:sec-independent protein translocase protein TatA